MVPLIRLKLINNMRVLMLLAVIGAVCASPRQGTRIIGGGPVNIESYPFMAALLHSYFGISFSHQCGGALVSSRAVLSAAHCFVDRSTPAWRVRLGSSFSLSGGSEHEVSAFIIRPDYNDRLILNDVAVVRLALDVVFSDKISMAFIAGSNFNTPDNTPLIAAGWGSTEFEGEFSESLQQVEVFSINQQVCAERYAYLKTTPGKETWPDVTPEMICTGVLDVGGKAPCQGDAGGPIIQGNNIAVGISSWGFECGHADYPSVNVRVPSYSSWIFNAAS